MAEAVAEAMARGSSGGRACCQKDPSCCSAARTSRGALRGGWRRGMLGGSVLGGMAWKRWYMASCRARPASSATTRHALSGERGGGEVGSAGTHRPLS